MNELGKNISASVRNRLTALAKTRGLEFQRILVLFALERLLYRLSISPDADRFILKGASLFSLWFDEPHRRTRDLDLLGDSGLLEKDDPDPAKFVSLFIDALASFLLPVLAAAGADGQEVSLEGERIWPPGGPWK